MRRLDRFSRPYNVSDLLLHRETIEGSSRLVRNRLQSSKAFVSRLELETDLVGHTGCVNCLEWNSAGTLLASGSDDLHVLFWDPFKRRVVQDLVTPHQGNIFGVKFMPQTGDSVVATAAADGKIFAFDRNHPEKVLLKCTCHDGRVKRLAVANETPYLFWSAAEDGSVFQLDIREPHLCSTETTKVSLICLSDQFYGAEIKCIATNPRRPELLAIGANDCFARLYDRRMMQVNTICPRSFENQVRNGTRFQVKDEQFPKGCVAYFSPGHLQSQPLAASQCASTFVSFSPDGRELLVNMGSEQIYLYDIYNTQETKIFEIPQASSSDMERAVESRKNRKIPEKVEQMKVVGNDLLEQEKFTEAVDQYTRAILASPTPYPALHLNRATALMKRKWRGDFYAALRDCKWALQLDPAYVKAHFRMARALLELKFPKEARDCLEEMRKRFPNYTNDHGVRMLSHDIEQAIVSKGEKDAKLSSSLTDEVSSKEMFWRSQAKDYQDRFVGSVNTKTDIKEANFFGADGKFIVSGSDDGNIFIFERPTGEIVEILAGDSQIVNCVQPHPSICMIASSGIDHDIRIWSPRGVEVPHKHRIVDINLHEEQLRMAREAFESNFFPSSVCRTS